MTYDEKIHTAVRDAAREGLASGQITFPLLNMLASTLANVVVTNNLNPNTEVEVVRHELDQLFTKYLDAYRKTPA